MSDLQRCLIGFTLALCRAIASCRDFLGVLRLLSQACSTLLGYSYTQDASHDGAEAADEELSTRCQALLAAAAAATAGQQADAQCLLRQQFYGTAAFQDLAESLLTVVGPDWLPQFSRAQRHQLFDAWFEAAPAAALLPALTRHLSAVVQPSGLPPRAGRARVTAVSADVAAGLLAPRFAAPCSSGVKELLQHVGQVAVAAAVAPYAGGDAAGAAAPDAAGVPAQAAEAARREGEGLSAALASVPERAAGTDRAELEPAEFVPAVVGQLVALLAGQQLAAARQLEGGGARSPDAAGAASTAATAFASDVLARFCRRGHQQQAAAALLQALEPQHPQQEGPGRRAELAAAGAVVSSVVAAIQDSSALGKLLEAALKAAAAEAQAGPLPAPLLPLDASPSADPAAQAAAAALASLLPPAVWLARADARLALTDKLLVQQQRRLLPLPAMRGLLLYLQQQQAAERGASSVVADAAARVAQLWGGAPSVQRLAPHHQAYLTAVLCGALSLLSRRQLDGHPQLLSLLLSGITTRLDSPLLLVRRQAMRVGQALSALLDPGKPPMFGDDDGQLQQLLPEEQWEEQGQGQLAQLQQDMRRPASLPGQNAGATGKLPTAPEVGSARQRRLEAREQRRRARAEQRARWQAQREQQREAEVEGPLTETDSDDEGSGSDADSVTSSGTTGSTSSGEFEQYDLEESDEEDPARSKLQLRDLPKMLLSKAEEDWKGQLRALRHAEHLIRAAPDELEQYAVPLARALLYTKVPAWLDEEAPQGGPPAGMQRFRDVVSLLAGAPEPAGLALAGEMYSPSLDVYQRAMILDGMASAAAEIAKPGSSLPPLPGVHKQPPQLPPGPAARAEAAGLTPEQRRLLTTTAHGSKRVGTVTRIASRSLAAAARRQGGQGPQASVNRFPPIALKWAAALLRHCDEPRHGVDLLGRDHFLLGKLLVTLGAFLEASSQSVEAATLAAATLELIRCGRVHNHPEPYVRRAALLAAGQVLGAVPPARLATAMLGSSGIAGAAGTAGGDAADHALVSRLEWLRDWTEQVAADDTDDSCRMMADGVHKLQGNLAAGALAALGGSQPAGTLDGGSLLPLHASGSGRPGMSLGGASLRLPDIRLP